MKFTIIQHTIPFLKVSVRDCLLSLPLQKVLIKSPLFNNKKVPAN